MAKYLIKRILSGLLVLFGVIVITFILSSVIPSDPARTWAGAKASAEQIEAARVKLGLDKPLIEQFKNYVVRLAHGDLGISYTSRRPIVDEMSGRVPATFEVVFYGCFFGAIIGLVMGVFSAKYKDGIIDHIQRFLSISLVSVPDFASAIILQIIFFKMLNILPLGERLSSTTSLFYNVPNITGWLTIDSLITGNWAVFRDALKHLILPASCIAPFMIGSLSRMTRSTLLEVMNEDYITAARSYGISENKIVWKLALKNCLGTDATVAALSLATALVSTFLIEQIFSWPGIGQFLANSVTELNYPAIMGATIFTTIVYMVLNLIADIVIAFDPRVRV